MFSIPANILQAIELAQLPTLPQVLLRFLKLVDDDCANASELAAVVSQDPALAARLLTIANSPAFRTLADIRSIDQCIVLLGTKLVRTIASCLAVQSLFARTASGMDYEFSGFWKHSILVAETARSIASETGYADPEEAYLAGLIHDIGELVMLAGIGDPYGELLDSNTDEYGLWQAEKAATGSDHATIGAWLTDKWDITSFLPDAVLFHHNSYLDIALVDTLSQIIWSAHVLSETNPSSETFNALEENSLSTIKSILGIDSEDITRISKLASERVELLAEALGIDISICKTSLPYRNGHLTAGSSPEKRQTISASWSGLEFWVYEKALMHTLEQNLFSSSSESDLLLAIRESAMILFGTNRLAIFTYSRKNDQFSGASIAGQPVILQQLEIPKESDASILCRSVANNCACTSFDDELAKMTLVDVQIARRLNSVELLAVPLSTTDAELFGVMVYGLMPAQKEEIRGSIDKISSFARLAAIGIRKLRAEKDEQQGINNELVQKHQSEIRQAVHETGNPLSIIKNYFSLLIKKLPDDSAIHEDFDILMEEINRVSSIIRKLADKEDDSLETETLDINLTIKKMLGLYENPLFSSRSIKLNKVLEPDLPLTKGSIDSFKQILLNLWKNSSEAMENGGQILITTRSNVIRNGKSFIEVRISDSGPGIPENVMKNLYKPVSKDIKPDSSGIGLSIVASLVETLNGEIICQSKHDSGTSFFIFLPT